MTSQEESKPADVNDVHIQFAPSAAPSSAPSGAPSVIIKNIMKHIKYTNKNKYNILYDKYNKYNNNNYLESQYDTYSSFMNIPSEYNNNIKIKQIDYTSLINQYNKYNNNNYLKSQYDTYSSFMNIPSEYTLYLTNNPPRFLPRLDIIYEEFKLPDFLNNWKLPNFAKLFGNSSDNWRTNNENYKINTTTNDTI